MAATVIQGHILGSMARIKHLLDSSANSTKLTAPNLLTQIQRSFERVATDINTMSSEDGWYYDYTIDPSITDYLLPAICDQVTNVTALDSSGKVVGEFKKRDQFRERDYNYGYDVRWPFIRLFVPSAYSTAVTLRVGFKANGEFSMNYGQITVATDATASTLVLPTAANMTGGFYDTRVNGYVGGWLRILNTTTTGTDNNVGEVVRVTAFAPATRTIAVSPSFSSLVYPDTGKPATWNYELVPSCDPKLWEAIVLDACRVYSGSWGRTTRKNAFMQEYVNHMRNLRLSAASVDDAATDDAPLGVYRPPLRRGY